MPTLATFNANNFFLRHKFAKTYPGDTSKKSAVDAAEISLGYVPQKAFGKYAAQSYVVWDPDRRDLAAQALAEPDGKLPDILCLQEVENMDSIRVLNERHFGAHYPYAMLIDGWDTRNIDVAVLSRFPLVDLRSHVDDKDSSGNRILSRDCLEATVKLPSGELLTLFINHLKSKYTDSNAGSGEALKGHQRRLIQAEYVAQLVKNRFKGQHDSALYAMLGDFNDTEESPWIKPLVKSSLLTNVIEKTRGREDRWTYYWRAKGSVQQIDYILASKAFAARVTKSHIERAGLAYKSINAQGEILPKTVTLTHFEDDGVTPLPPASVVQTRKIDFPRERYAPIFDDVSLNVSDHCPVKIWF